MYPLSSIRQAGLSHALSLLRSCGSLKWLSETTSKHVGVQGALESLNVTSNPTANVGNLGRKLDLFSAKENVSASYALTFQCSIHSSAKKDDEKGGFSRSMNFVRGVIEENGIGLFGGYEISHKNKEQNADFVNINLKRNNTYVTVTDSKGNTICKASSGCLPELKGGAKVSRYAAEATAEHVGRMARNLGLKSVVVKVKGFTYFRKKRQAILSFREGFANSRGGQNPIVYIEDTTRKPHNGCRLPRKRRI